MCCKIVYINHILIVICRPDGQKKAYVKLPADVEAADVASKIGLI